MNPKPLNAVMTETVTATLDDHEEVVFVVDNVPLTPVSSTVPTDIQEDDVDIMPPIPVTSSLPPSPSRVSPPATIIATNISKHPLASSTSSDLLSVKSRVSRDPDWNSPGMIATNATAVTRSSNLGLLKPPTILSREPA